MTCPGCNGRRWVESRFHGPSKCPVCIDGAEVVKDDGKYNQDRAWLMMTREVPATLDEAIEKAMASYGSHSGSSILHLLFSKNITPQGNLIFNQVMIGSLVTRSHLPEMTPERLAMRGYAVEDGKVRVVNDVPVGPIYGILQGWGSKKDIVIDANRKGNPYFLDNNMAAVGVTFGNPAGIPDEIRELKELCMPVGTLINTHLVPIN